MSSERALSPAGVRMPRRLILADEVYLHLKSLIMDGSIPPGVRLNIEELARRLEVSPTPVRESLARLEADGLADKLPLKGYRTTDLLDRTHVEELYELRLMLEPASAGRAAERMTGRWASELTAEIDSCQVAPQDSHFDSYQTLASHDERLHSLILTIAGNETVKQSFLRTHCHLHIFRLSYAGTFGDHTLIEHKLISEAALAGDADAAQAAMRSHLEASRDRVLAQFESGTLGISDGRSHAAS